MAATEDQKRNRFVSSTLKWMSANDPETGTVEEIATRLQAISDDVLPATPQATSDDSPPAHGACGPLIWRIKEVIDFRNQPTLPAGERLMRWEISPPEDVFINGIISVAERKARKDPKDVVSSIKDLNAPVADLRSYVRNWNGSPIASIFVSTSRTWSDSTTGEIKRIVPDHEQVIKRHEYEIFVHGGIDVTLSGESGHNFTKEDEREISFTGGIRREFIRSVRTYPRDEGIKGKPVVLENPYFNPSANGQGVSVALPSLPAIVDLASGIEVKTWIPPPPGSTRSVHPERAKGTPPAEIPPPAMNWTAMGDETATSDRVPMTRASFTKSDGSEIWFANNSILVVNNESEKPSPVSIAEHWPGVIQAGITRIDAVLTTPSLSEKNRLFIFSGENCAQIEESSGNVVYGSVQKISEAWPALGQEGFSEVDAVLPYPAPSTTVAFFRKKRYALITFDAEKDSTHGKVTKSGEYAAHWPVLEDYPFLDAVLVDQENNRMATFYSGDRHKSTEIEPSTEAPKPAATASEADWTGAEATQDDEDEIARGSYEGLKDEHTASRGRSVYGQQSTMMRKWAALKNAGFY